MKKIIALILVLGCVFALAACGKEKSLESVSAMYAASKPTKSELVYSHDLGGVTLTNRYSIVNGEVDGKAASVYTSYEESLRTVEDGGINNEIKEIIVKEEIKLEAIEGIGSRVNGGEWDPEGKVTSIYRGVITLKLTEDTTSNVEYKDHVLTLNVPAASTASVFGSELAATIDGDVSVTIVDDGAVITAVTLVYNVKGNSDVNLAASKMTVNVNYSYDIERIDIE